MKEVVAAKTTDLSEGQMKTVLVDGRNLLLSKIGGKFYAVSPFCTHYGAELEDGILKSDRITCPWHNACFNAKTGEMLEPPALDSLNSFETEVREDQIIVKLPDVESESRHPEMTIPDPVKDDEIYVIVGGGAAGYMAAQTLRQDGFNGRIVMITMEDRLPYDRPNLSKDYLAGDAEDEWMPLRGEDFFKKYKIETIINSRVRNVDTFNKEIVHDNGTINFHKVLFATGGEPRNLNVPGNSLDNIFYLRSYNDSQNIIEAVKNVKNAVVVGASFIGMETAHSLMKRGLNVTVAAPEKLPFENIFGTEIGKMFKKKHEESGIIFKLGRTVKEFEGNNNVEGVLLDNNEEIDADLAAIGIGIKPVSNLSGNIRPDDDGAFKVDKFLRLSDSVFAAGDCAKFDDWRTGEEFKIEHWRTAMQQGAIAAHNMYGKNIEYRKVPFFWTEQAGLELHYVGHAKEWDEIIFDGEIEDEQFIAYYIKNDKVHAAAGIGRNRDIAAISELMRLGRMPKKKDLDGFEPVIYLRKI